MYNRKLEVVFLVIALVGGHLYGSNGRRTIDMGSVGRRRPPKRPEGWTLSVPEVPPQEMVEETRKENGPLLDVRTLLKNTRQAVNESRTLVINASTLNERLKIQKRVLAKMIAGISGDIETLKESDKVKHTLKVELHRLKSFHEHIEFLSNRCRSLTNVLGEIKNKKMDSQFRQERELLSSLEKFVIDLKRKCDMNMGMIDTRAMMIKRETEEYERKKEEQKKPRKQSFWKKWLGRTHTDISVIKSLDNSFKKSLREHRGLKHSKPQIKKKLIQIANLLYDRTKKVSILKTHISVRKRKKISKLLLEIEQALNELGKKVKEEPETAAW